MKFLFFTDTHIRGTTPRNRKDNFYETLKEKFREIGRICSDHGIDYILHGGDWFDRPDISPSIVREFAVIIKGFNRPLYTVAGNHDLFGHNPDTIGRTMLGLLEGIGIMKLLTYDETLVLEKDGLRVQLDGKSYNYDIDGENYRKYYIVKKRNDVDYAINVVHGMLLAKPFFTGIQYTLLEDIADTGADVTLAGHYHSGFGTRQLDGKYFINPGSMVRVTNNVGEMKRKPGVVIIELGKDISIKQVDLISALPGDEVLDRTQLECSQDRNLKLHQFYQGITSAAGYKRIDINDIIERIGADSEISRNVRDEAIRRIAVARENLSHGDEDV